MLLNIPIELFLGIIISLIGLISGSITDLKKREVPDWINYSLVFSGFFLALIVSIIKNDFLILLHSLFGFLFFFIIGVLMFYTGQWGGGDSKMLMGLGALIGINIILPIKDNITNWINNPPLILIFLILTLLVGAIYGIFWCIGLAIINRKQFLIEIKKILIKPKIKIVKIICFIIMVVLFTLSFFINDKSISLILIIFAFLCGFLFYMSIFVKAIEKTSMIKKINPKKLTEGDWIAEDIIVDKKIIAKKGDIITKKIINEILKIKSFQKVLIKRKLFLFHFKKIINSDEINVNDKLEQDFKIDNLSFNKGHIITLNDFVKINTLYGYYQIKRKRKFLNFLKKYKIFKKLLFFISEFRIMFLHYANLKNNDIILHDINLDNFFVSKKTILDEKILNQINEYFKFSFNSINIKRKFFNIPFRYKFDEKKIKENDILLNDLFFGEYVAGPKDLGVEKKQINTLIKLYKQKKIPYVVIKEGIPFVPSFLISFILSIIIYLLY
ncbi:MAG: prepilin peptidase [Candidatus Woesearchaeota archaeon]